MVESSWFTSSYLVVEIFLALRIDVSSLQMAVLGATLSA
jgi:hypothetical protein